MIATTKKNLIVSLLVLLIILVMLVIYGLYAYGSSNDLGLKTASVIVSQGDGFNRIADLLVSKNVVDSRFNLKLFARLRGVDKKLTPGRYDFEGSQSIKTVLDRLEQADFLRIKITFSEGLPIWRSAALLASRMEIDSSLIMQFNNDSSFLAELNLPYLEGYLFPETYFFPWGTSAYDMLREMVSMYRTQTDSLWSETHSYNNIPVKLSPEEIIILASIVEAEALLDREKPKIASVYLNRLKRKMKLDADPTVIYGLGGLDHPLWHRDLRKDTPYNTYMRKGLPPTPINSPGLAAIRAVLNPIETEYLFFVADGSGGHRFSKTNAEHNRARRDIKREQAAKKN